MKSFMTKRSSRSKWITTNKQTTEKQNGAILKKLKETLITQNPEVTLTKIFESLTLTMAEG